MSRIRGKNTGPEIALRRLLHRLGYRFRIHAKGLPGTPDVVFPKRRKVLFVHGCFWHRHPGCSKAYVPKTRQSFWADKFAANVARDERNYLKLREQGWDIALIWECELGTEERIIQKLEAFLGPPSWPEQRPAPGSPAEVH